ncbi:hypothetical protein EJB05_05056 [Eragrostis curvula]|uniref:Uncharacterized protein n=1 Tax=Eragrostis curvula TaxID=38414 RepID=A0A5J9WCD4_9POAL|nr:hypothetical protein EJB05_05056 [Eragrostis curvula]
MWEFAVKISGFSQEIVEAEQELIELQKHVSAQGILVQDLTSDEPGKESNAEISAFKAAR